MMQVRVDAHWEAKDWVRCASLSACGAAAPWAAGRIRALKRKQPSKTFPTRLFPSRPPRREGLLPAKACLLLGVRCFSKKFLYLCFFFAFLCFDSHGFAICAQHEGEEQKCSEESSREGKRRVSRAGQVAATAVGHHQSTGQSVHHPPHHQLPQNETRLSWWWVHVVTNL